MNKLQIGVMGSAADLKYSKEFELVAERIGELIAQSDGILFFGAEKDYDSLSAAACRGAKNAGGTTVGVTYGKGKDIWQPADADIIIPTGLERGGGRELVLVLACDAIISISGGSGTLTELAIAYQANIPMVALTGYGGWSDKLANTYFDARERQQVVAASTPEEAVNLAFEKARSYQQRSVSA
jgi:uncharacterized protein (TIGR00725 family)